MNIDKLLENSIEACNSINKIRFKDDGIFTNSVVKDKDITNLITDLNIELPKDEKPSDDERRKRKYFLSYDSDSHMLIRYDGAQYYEDEKYYSGDFNNNEVTIKVPNEQFLDKLSMGNNCYLLNKLEDVSNNLQRLLSQRMNDSSNVSLIEETDTSDANEGNMQSTDNENDDLNKLEPEYLDQLIDILLKLNYNYPINNLESYVHKLKSKNTMLSKELAELRDINQDIKAQLKKLNINLDERQLLQFELDRKLVISPGEKSSAISGKDIILKKKKQLKELKAHKESLLSS